MYVKICIPCQSVKTHRTIRPKVDKSDIQDRRFSTLQEDIVGPLPMSRGFSYIQSVIDINCRWIEAIPFVEATAYSCATALISGWIQRFGLPHIIKSDNGNTFAAALWQELQAQLGIKVPFTPPYHASSLGAVKRCHRDIKASLKAALVQMANTAADKLADRLPWIMWFRRSMI